MLMMPRPDFYYLIIIIIFFKKIYIYEHNIFNVVDYTTYNYRIVSF